MAANIPFNLLGIIEYYGGVSIMYDYENGIEYATLSDGGKEVQVQGILDAEMSNLTIPPEIMVHDYWADHYYPHVIHPMCTCTVTSIRSIAIPVIEEGDISHFYPWSLQSIKIPKTVLSIYEGVFRPLYGNLSSDTCDIFDGSISALTEIHVDSDNPNYSDEDGVLYNKDKSVLIACPSAKTECNIPATVTQINNYAFSGCRNLKTITIPNSVTKIGSSVFEGCANLETITIPESVDSIGDYAFKNCESLVSIDFPASLISIGTDMFGGCCQLKEIHISPANDRFSDVDGALYDKKLSEVLVYPRAAIGECTIPSSVTVIGESAFSGCASLTAVNLPPSVATIEKNAFAGCTSLPSIVIPTSVTVIGESAFSGCASLTSVTIPSSVNKIGCEAFRNCTSLSDITLPNGLESIEVYTFANCRSLSEITIPASVECIGFGAFENCISLLTIKSMSMTPPKAGTAFGGVPIIADVYVPKRTVPYYLKSNGWSEFYYYYEVEEWVTEGISDVTADDITAPQDIYTLQGICIKRNAAESDIDVLPEGLYIIGGKKVYLKR